ncbi:hypothetical protein B0H17DRAFT_1214917 [Mycena rosella]|uniref:F-box domain-containing protein n=1 Tax=Mycena rosella TaxID=1033263 RepID=A0AAD7CLZ6_MYCRO|nr:hypothetical protein B0H17DRAFT_1214917 [Mycena rosella]
MLTTRIYTSLHPTALLNLPLETIHEICSYIGLADLIWFSISCQFLWEIGRQQIYRRIEAIAANQSWAGDRIICVGDYLRNDDIPENLLTPEEEEEFTGEDEDGEIFTLYFLQRAQPGVLRNLSRRQFVRESALVDLKAGELEELKNVGFSEVVLSRICFSSDSSVSMSYDGGIHRGVWAGDRFDIVGSEWLQGLEDDASWTDVSDEQVRSLDFGFRSDFFDYVKAPNFQSLSSEELAKCLHSVPSLLTLQLESDNDDDDAPPVFECLTEVSIIPHLRALTMHISGSVEYEPVVEMVCSRRDTPLRTIHLSLDVKTCDWKNPFSYYDGGWLLSQIFRDALETLGVEVYVKTPDGSWPESLEARSFLRSC